MAGRSSLNAKNLEGLGAVRLAALLMQLTEGNAAARRTLRLALAEQRGPEEMAQEVRKRLAAVERSNRWLETRERDALLADLERQRQAIAGAIAEQAPALALELQWRFLELAPSLLDRCDDSDEVGLRFFHRLSADLGAVACRAGRPSAALADQVAEVWLGPHCRQYEPLILHLAPALASEGLLRLRARMEAERPAEADPEPLWVEENTPDWQGEDDDEDGGVCTRSDIYGHYTFYEPEPDDDEDDVWIGSSEPDRRQRVRLAMLAIADGLGDAQAYWAEYRDHHPSGLRRPRIAVRVARRLAAAGQLEPALAVLDGVVLRQALRSDGYRRWLDVRLTVLEALERREEAQRLRREFALERLSIPHLRDYLRRLPAFEDEPACEAALDAVLAHPRGHAALEFLHRWPDRRRTARLILQRPDQLFGGDDTLLEGVAEVLEASQPLAASVCWRVMVEFILETGQSNRYSRAVRHLASCRRLAVTIDDWGKIPHHNRYVRDLLRAYDHRPGFLNKLDYDNLLVEEAPAGRSARHPAAGTPGWGGDVGPDGTDTP
jgi:hypothetical protein